MKGFYFTSPLLSLAASHSWRCHRSSLSSASQSSASKFHHLGIMDVDLHEEQSQKNVVKKSSSSKSAATALHKIKHKISKRSSESTSRQRSHKNSDKKSDSNITFKDQKKNRLVLQDGKLRDGIELHYISKGEKLLKGYTKGCGVLCCHCNKVVSPTMFESHAGRSNSRKPYQHIFLSNGISLHQYASSLKLNCQKSVENNVLLCMVCQKSGDLLSCDGCPRSFHKECMSESEIFITPKKQFCKRCQISMKSLVPKANHVKDRKFSGVGPSEPMGKQCIQIDGSCDLVACVLCRSCDFSEDGFSDQTSIVCDQCEKEYHIGCLRKDMNIDLKELPTGNWFCTEDCGNLHSFIELVIAFGPLKAENDYMELFGKKIKGSDVSVTHFDIRWFVFNGKDANEVEQPLLTEAVDIFRDCFNPIIDIVTKKDFIPSMAYGEQMGSSNFSGIYTAVITVDSEVVTAGMFRVLGRDLAELPIVATSKPNQGATSNFSSNVLRNYFHFYELRSS